MPPFDSEKTWLHLRQSIFTRHSRQLIVQSQQWKHQNNMRSLFKVNNKDIRTTSMILGIVSKFRFSREFKWID